MEELLNKPIWQMTGQEFLSLINKEDEKNEQLSESNSTVTSTDKYVYGIRGIANLMNCSIATANRVKKSGILDDAIIQYGRTIMVEVDKALELLKKFDNKKA